jgi:ribosomal protein S18 acetylase RimI-like enzyme
MARGGDAAPSLVRHPGPMHTRYVDGVTVRPLRDGDTGPVEALFARLGLESRARRFGGAKPCLSARELELLARVDGDRHVLVAYLAGDPEPAGIARLVREGTAAEVAVAVADVHQGRGLGSLLARELAGDARAAGVTELRATVTGDNPAAVSLLRRLARSLHLTREGAQRELVARLGSGS